MLHVGCVAMGDLESTFRNGVRGGLQWNVDGTRGCCIGQSSSRVASSFAKGDDRRFFFLSETNETLTRGSVKRSHWSRSSDTNDINQ